MSDADLYMRIEKTCDRIAEARGDVRNKLMTGLSKEKKLAAEAVLREYGTGKVCSHFDGKLCAENEELKRFFFWQFDEINGNNKLIDFYAMTILDAPEIKAAAKILGGPKTYALIRDALFENKETIPDFGTSEMAALALWLMSWDDILALEGDDLRRFIHICQRENFDIACALKVADVEQRNAFFNKLPPKYASLLKEDFEFTDKGSSRKKYASLAQLFFVLTEIKFPGVTEADYENQ